MIGPVHIKIKKTHDKAVLPLITEGNACFDFLKKNNVNKVAVKVTAFEVRK